MKWSSWQFWQFFPRRLRSYYRIARKGGYGRLHSIRCGLQFLLMPQIVMWKIRLRGRKQTAPKRGNA